MKTKEEILNGGKGEYSLIIGNDAALKAMDEYAEEHLKAFLRWKYLPSGADDKAHKFIDNEIKLFKESLKK